MVLGAREEMPLREWRLRFARLRRRWCVGCRCWSLAGVQTKGGAFSESITEATVSYELGKGEASFQRDEGILEAIGKGGRMSSGKRDGERAVQKDSSGRLFWRGGALF